MVRTILLAGAALIAAPAAAQGTTDTDVGVDAIIPTSPGERRTTLGTDASATPQAGATTVRDDQSMVTPNTTIGTQASGLADSDSAATSGTSAQVGEQVPVTSPDMMRPAQSNQSSASMMAERMGMGGPLNIESNWSRFDMDSNGILSPLEFGMWIMETNGRDMSGAVEAEMRGRASGNAAVEVLNATAGALAQVDTNGDWKVSRDELAMIAE